MTEGFLSIPIMRPNHCWAALRVSILAVLLLTLKADSSNSECNIEIKVRRHTVYSPFLGEHVRINCTVGFCNDSPPEILWQKLEKTPVSVNSSSHIKFEWKHSSHVEGTSFLIFQHILRSDSGLYRCQSEGNVGHNINVSVHDRPKGECNNVTQVNDTMKNSTAVDPESKETLWRYVYTAAGIVPFVIVVIIVSIASMRGCKGTSKKQTLTDTQNMAIPMVEQPPPCAGLQPSPRGSPTAPQSRVSTPRKTPLSQLSELPSPRNNEQLYGKTEEDRETQRNSVKEEEEGSSVVYAALNHQLPARAAARPQRPTDESSEYAAIRVKGPAPTRHWKTTQTGPSKRSSVRIQ